MRRWLLGLVGVAGCGRIGFDLGGPGGGNGDAFVADPDATTAPGTRLHARYWTGSDGSHLFASFYDPMTGSRCTFSADRSGTLRCFPNEVITQFSYADAGCATPTLRVATGCASTPTLATVQASSTTSSYSQAVSFGAKTAGFLGLISCTAATDGAAYYLVGPAVPDTMFVAGTRTTVALADGLERQELVAEDGSRQNLGYSYQGTTCRVAKLTATTAACIPEAAIAYTSPRMYSDTACAVEVAQVGGSPPPAYATALDGESPCHETRYVSTGAQQVLTTLYVRNSTGGCSAITQTSATYSAITDVTSTLPVLSRVIDPGTTRLRTWAWVSPGGARLEAGLYDTALGAACTPTVDTTGTATCAPLGFAWPVNHVNAMCNMPGPAAEALCDGEDSAQPMAISPDAEVATCNGLGIPLSTYTTKSTATAGYDSYAGACVPMNLADATLFTTTTSAYQPSRVVGLTLQ